MMDKVGLGIIGSQFAAHLHLHNYAGLRGSKVEVIDAVLFDREPVSGIDLALEVVEAIYAAYASAEKGMRVELRRD